MLSCQEKLKEKLSPSFPPLRHSPLLLHQESARSALCHLPGAIWELGRLRNLLLVLNADTTQCQAWGPACTTACTPRPLLHGYEHAHAVGTHTVDRPARTGQEGGDTGLWSEGTGRRGREQQDPPELQTAAAQLSSTSLRHALLMAPHSSLNTAAPNPRARTNGITVGPVPSLGGRGALGHPEPPSTFREASRPPSYHVPCQKPPDPTF